MQTICPRALGLEAYRSIYFNKLVMKVYYEIARHSICVDCKDSSVLDAVDGFSVFLSKDCVAPEMCVYLEAGEPQPIAGKPYYSVTTDIATCLFYRNGTQCGLEIKRGDELKLSLIGSASLQAHYLQGSMEPALLRFALWFAFNMTFAPSKTIAIHASAIVYKGRAWLYTGKSGTGKSTHTRLINSCFLGVELLNDDSPIVRIENGKCMVYGSPWSGKTSCYKQRKVELGGIIRLYQDTHNRMEPLAVHQAIGALLPSFPPELYLNEMGQQYVIDIMSDILGVAEIFSLRCLPNKEAAELSVETICNVLTRCK